MTEQLIFALALVSALGCGLNAGVFFGFSAFVMKALARLPAAQAAAAMQSINVMAVTPLFMGALFGTGILSVIIAVLALLGWDRPGTAWLLAGSVLYLAGIVRVTMFFNVPLNNALAAVEPSSPEGARLWTRYLKEWTAWNHVRTIAGLAALGSFILALV